MRRGKNPRRKTYADITPSDIREALKLPRQAKPGKALADLSPAEVRRLVKPKPPSEHAEQIALVYQVRSHLARYPELGAFFAIPNQGGKDESARLRQIMRQKEGLSPGYPDTALDLARGGWHGLRIELKKSADWNDRTGEPYARGEPSGDQIAWHLRLTRNGFLVAVSWGWEPAWSLLQWYIALEDSASYEGARPVTPDMSRLLIYEYPRS